MKWFLAFVNAMTTKGLLSVFGFLAEINLVFLELTSVCSLTAQFARFLNSVLVSVVLLPS